MMTSACVEEYTTKVIVSVSAALNLSAMSICPKRAGSSPLQRLSEVTIKPYRALPPQKSVLDRPFDQSSPYLPTR